MNEGIHSVFGLRWVVSSISIGRHNPCSGSGMIYFVLGRIFSLLLDLIDVTTCSDHEKDLEILLLRQQVRILQRKHPHPPCLFRWETLGLAILAARLISLSSTGHSHVAQVALLFKPETVLTWRRELVRRKWTVSHERSTGRPPIAPDLEAPLLRLANENPR